MSTVCIAVIVIVLVTMFMFVRSQNREYSSAMWPLVIVPCAHLCGGILSSAFRDRMSRESWLLACIVLDLAALLAFILLLFFKTGAKITGRRSRRVFILLSLGFMCVFTAILVMELSREISGIYAAREAGDIIPPGTISFYFSGVTGPYPS